MKYESTDMKYKQGDQIFPTNHPFMDNDDRSVSNVRMGSYTFQDGVRVIPHMVDGQNLGTVQALQRAEREGIDKYPLFKSVREAEEWIRMNHQNVDAKGRYKPKR